MHIQADYSINTHKKNDDVIDHGDEFTKEAFLEALTQDYSTFTTTQTVSFFDKAWKAFGLIGWVVCYVAIIVTHFDSSFCLVPYSLLSYNLVWEYGRTFIWTTNDHWMTAIFAVGWFGLDLVILKKFWEAGNDRPESLDEQRIGFLKYFFFFVLVTYILTKFTDSMARIWRHLSYYWAIVLQLTILGMNETHHFPLHAWMQWGAALGNFGCMIGALKLYKEFYRPQKYPIRFFIIVFDFIPVALLSMYCMWKSVGDF